MTALMPNSKAPPLDVETMEGGRWSLAARKPKNFTLVVFYRGLHCPVCKGYLGDLESKLGDFAARGVEAIAVSGDPRDRAAEAKKDWGLEKLTIGYGMSVEAMRAWGLYVSKSIREGETALFNEPGLFLIRPDGTVYYVGINSMPFGRPSLAEMLQRLDFILEKNYPARGEA